MWFNIIAGLFIFGYATYTVWKYVNKAKKGKCAACELNQSCKVDCSVPSE